MVMSANHLMSGHVSVRGWGRAGVMIMPFRSSLLTRVDSQEWRQGQTAFRAETRPGKTS
jgi:hypothetical protein